MSDLPTLRRQLENRKGKRDQLQHTIDGIQEELKREQRRLSRYERALEIVKQVGLTTQKQLEYHLSEQVSLAMSAVFTDPYELKVNFLEKRGQTEVELLFTRDTLEFPPLGSAGGGAIDVASLALRVAYWTMRQDQKVRPLLLLDEPFSRLKGSEPNRRALAVLQQLSQDLGLQIITVSDERVPREDIVDNADKVYHVMAADGRAKVSEVE